MVERPPFPAFSQELNIKIKPKVQIKCLVILKVINANKRILRKLISQNIVQVKMLILKFFSKVEKNDNFSLVAQVIYSTLAALNQYLTCKIDSSA
jgi:hypothetical protein